MGTIIIFVLIISLLVFVHEFGHFISAKRAGVRVDEFGIGFPPRMFGKERGGTLYSINWIPLGGFVKIKGEGGEDRDDEDSFGNKSIPRRALILSAGVIMNLFLAWALLTVGYIIGLPQATDDVSANAIVSQEQVRIVQVLDDSPASGAELKPGDAVISMGGAVVGTIDDMRAFTADHLDEEVSIVVERGEETLELAVTPMMLEEIERPGIGVALATSGLVSYPIWLAPVEALRATVYFTSQIIGAFVSLIRDLIVTQEAGVEFSGPIGIAVLTAQVAELGFRHLLQFTALLSINLAVINILPIPALDGGRLFFLFMEAVRRKPVDRKFEVTAHNIGFSLLMVLIVVITYGDVVRFGGSILKATLGLFGA